MLNTNQIYVVEIPNAPQLYRKNEYDCLAMLLDQLLFETVDLKLIAMIKYHLKEINYHTGGRLELVSVENGEMIFSNHGEILIFNEPVTRKVLIEKIRK